jgi:HTH-type transcriptional regulator/antitoxin HigA
MEGLIMPAIQASKNKLPSRFSDLVAMMPPQAIMDDVQHENVLQLVDQLMSLKKLSKGQEQYLETWVQLVGVYEATHHAIDTSDMTGVSLLAQLLQDNDMNASDLARLLGVHASMGSKILKGERALTVEHLRKLSDRFLIKPDVFMTV